MFHNQGFTSLGEDIYLYSNFASEEECKKIIEKLENLPESSWYNLDVGIDSLPEMLEITLLKKRLISFLDKGLNLGDNSSVVRMSIGSFHGQHSDNHDFKNSPENILYGIIIYLNNFEGGEIYYPTQKIEYKPKIGDLIIHSAKSHCIHGVKSVKSNFRYVHSNHIFELATSTEVN